MDILILIMAVITLICALAILFKPKKDNSVNVRDEMERCMI